MKAKQTEMKFRTWGGKRKGAGRKPNGEKAGLPHCARPDLNPKHPVHVTLRMRDHVWNLRSRRCFRVLRKAFTGGATRFGFRLVHYSVQGNHIHLLVEASSARALSRGVKGLSIRIAKRLNRQVMGGKGSVFADRYHAHILKTPAEVRNARRYLLKNDQHHGYALRDRLDEYCSFALPEGFVAEPKTWLLGHGWQKQRQRPGSG